MLGDRPPGLKPPEPGLMEGVLAGAGTGEGSRTRLLELADRGTSLAADSMAAEKLPD